MRLVEVKKRGMLDEHKQKIGENEGIFRSVNERVRPLDETWMTIFCECGDKACRDQVVVAQSEYAHVREDSASFIVRPGHEIGETEDVIVKNLEFWIVRKHDGVPAAIARETDPNS